MGRWQGRSDKKPTGGRIWPKRGKRKREMGREFIEVRLAQVKKAKLRVYGGGRKTVLYSSDMANVADPKTGRITKAKILTVVGNPADPHFVRRNVITKGAIVQTEIGRAKVTSRPGQDGVVNAVLIEEKPQQ
ncbi:MAG: 30S ribosomal protein S8e [Candidatus Hadarchaeales archaeon]